MSRVYLDHNATSPLCEAGRKEWLRVTSLPAGNPSSIHAAGREARELLETARESIARSIGAVSGEIVFTSGGTEANNQILKSFSSSARSIPIVSTKVEHASISRTLDALENSGRVVRYVRVDSTGVVDLDHLETCLETGALVSIQSANQETGVRQPVDQIANLCQARNAIFHSDASQSLGKEPISVSGVRFDFLSLSAHKFGGPVGIGAIYARGRHLHSTLANLLQGGSQEFDRRPGTTPVALASSFSKALEHRLNGLQTDSNAVRAKRDRLCREITRILPDTRILTPTDRALPNTLCCAFRNCDRLALTINLDLAGICVSPGSACSSGSLEPSPVLLAMGIDPAYAQGAIRLSLAPSNSEEDVDRLLEALPNAVARSTIL